jgi:type III secretory pathway component EscR
VDVDTLVNVDRIVCKMVLVLSMMLVGPRRLSTKVDVA